MGASNDLKAIKLGMPFGTANNKLRKALLFYCVQRLGEDICYRCGFKITTVDDFSIDHKVSWLNSITPVQDFFNVLGIAYSHMSCNSAAASRPRVYDSLQDKRRENARAMRADPVRYRNTLDLKIKRYHK